MIDGARRFLLKISRLLPEILKKKQKKQGTLT